MIRLYSASLALALAAPLGALADTPPTASDINTLRQDIEAMRASYEARLQALEQRLKVAETAAAAASASVLNANPEQAAPSLAALPAPSGGANSFNPSMSLILSGIYTRTTRDPANYAITGFQLPAGSEAGPGTRGFSLSESELGFAASIDPWLRGAANISLHANDAVSVEEAYVQTTSLGNGLSVKAGRFFSGVGYLNPQHAHTWDFTDNPLAYQALLGTQYGDDGLQLSWLAPTDQYIELGAELGRGRSFPGNNNSRNGAGMTAFTAHTGGDIGASHNWRAGLSVLNAKATGQGLSVLDKGGTLVANAFSGKTRVWIADAVWKWAPNGNATQINFKLQGEYLRSTRNGNLTYDTANINSADAYRAVQSGWYVQAIYQFMPGWRVGVRTEQLDPGTPDYGINTSALTGDGYKPRKNTLMLDYNPSEFSRVRLQLAQDRSREGRADKQLFIQYQMSLGAHGAHAY
jgi:hypothetical protein